MPKLTITKMLVPNSKRNIKCPYSMKPSAITRHDTANDASAMAEVSYMIGNNRQVSYHYAVDDYRAVLGINPKYNAWHCGDGSRSKSGNRTSIGVEVCYSKSGGSRYAKANDNALTLIAMLMKKYGIPVTRVYYHRNWSGKRCPHRLISQGVSLSEYRKLIQARYHEMYGGGKVVNTVKPTTPSKTKTKHKVGDKVKFKGLAASSSSKTHKSNVSITSGKITRIVEGARYPYLINGGTGWVNDNLITSTGSTINTPKVNSNTKVTYYPKSDKSTLIASLNAIGVDSSFNNRAKIAVVNGIVKSTSKYTGSETQNSKMKSLLSLGKLIKSKSSLPTAVKTSSSYYKKYTGKSDSLVSALSSIGVDSSYNHRKSIAKANGIKDYSGTAKQNTTLLNYLKNGKLKKA